MQIHMEDVLSNLPLEILQGNRMVEVRHQVRDGFGSVPTCVTHLVHDVGMAFASSRCGVEVRHLGQRSGRCQTNASRTLCLILEIVFACLVFDRFLL